MLLSVVIPAYNESENIIGIIRELYNSISTIPGFSRYQIIVVDDHSSDSLYKIVQSIDFVDNITCLRLSRRSGSHTAIRAGIKIATGDMVLCIAADGQDDPKVLSKMTEKIQSGCNIIWAVRKAREESFVYKMVTLTFYKLLRWASNTDAPQNIVSNADFFLFDKQIRDAVNACEERNTSLFGLLLWMGFNQDFVEYERRERRGGKSKWNFRSRIRLAKDWIMAFSGLPLKIMSLMGITFAAVGFLYAVFIMAYSLLGYTTPGWAETIIIILILSGLQMTMLGIMGEYLWRNLDETRKRPLYFIEKRSNRNK